MGGVREESAGLEMWSSPKTPSAEGEEMGKKTKEILHIATSRSSRSAQQNGGQKGKQGTCTAAHKQIHCVDHSIVISLT